MGSAQGSLGQAVVAVALSPSHQHLFGQSDASLRDEIRDFVGDLLSGLALPVDVDVRIARASAEEDRPANVPYTVRVNGDRCRIELPSAQPDVPPSVRLAPAIAADLCRNRRLFLSPGLSERLQARWSARPGVAAALLTPDAFRSLLLRLVERGIRVDRVATLTMPGDAGRFLAVEDAIAAAAGVRVLLSGALRRRLAAGTPRGDTRTFERLLESLPRLAFGDRGVHVDPVRVDVDPRLGEAEFRIQLNDVRWPAVEGLAEGEWLVAAPPERLRDVGIPGAPAPHPLTALACVRVQGDDEVLEKCRRFGATLGPAGFIASSARALMARYAGHLLTVDGVRLQLERLRQAEPALADATVSRFEALHLTWILRELVDGGVSVRDLRNVLEVLLSLEGSKASARAQAGAPPDVVYWADWVRAGLKRQITFHHWSGATLGVYLLAADLEQRIAASDDRPLDETEQDRLLRQLVSAQAAHPRQPLVVLASPDAARRLRRLIACELPRAAVIGYQELSPDASVQTYGRIGEA